MMSNSEKKYIPRICPNCKSYYYDYKYDFDLECYVCKTCKYQFSSEEYISEYDFHRSVLYSDSNVVPERMCDLRLMQDYLPSWKHDSQQIDKEGIFYLEYVDLHASFLYCDACEKEMYWPGLYAGRKIISENEINGRYSKVSNYIRQLDTACRKANDDYIVLRDKKIENCPCCGEKIVKDSGHYLWVNRPTSMHTRIFEQLSYTKRLYKDFSEEEYREKINKKFKDLREERFVVVDHENNEIAKDFARRNIKRFVRDNEDSSDNSVLLNTDSNEIKTQTEKLKQFVYEVLRMETGIYGLTKRLEDLYYQRKKDELDYQQVEKKKEFRKGMLERKITEEETIFQNYAPTKASFGISDPAEPRKPSEPLLVKPGLFNKKKVEAENKRLQEEYKNQLDEYSIQYQEYQNVLLTNEELYKKRVEEEKQKLEEGIESLKQESLTLSQVASDAFPTKEVIEKEIEMAENALRNTYIARNNFYNTNIIYMKYRDPVALSSFYEYLMSGRCTGLEGADGAYNIYENEVRMNLIISQLDKVIISLEQIKKNQFTIYNELREVNANLNSLSSSMSEAIDSIHSIEKENKRTNERLDTISHNTAVTAYYSKINAYYSKKTAETSQAIGWLVALK